MQEHPIQHILDVMHIEKNICSALFKTLTNTKGTKADSHAQRREMKNMGIMRDFWITGEHEPKKPTWIFTKSEYRTVIDIITEIRTPREYGSSFQYKFVDGKLSGMKTHDYHNLLHHILPIAVRGTLTADIKDIIYRLGGLFRWVCAKEVSISEIKSMEAESSELMCKMELNFPPSFFDIMPHLLVHIVKEIELVGPVPFRWMYFLERYMKDLKGWVRQKARPEGCMAEGYILQEAMTHLSEYTQRLDPKASLLNEDPDLITMKLPKVYRLKSLQHDTQGLFFCSKHMHSY